MLLQWIQNAKEALGLFWFDGPIWAFCIASGFSHQKSNFDSEMSNNSEYDKKSILVDYCDGCQGYLHSFRVLKIKLWPIEPARFFFFIH